MIENGEIIVPGSKVVIRPWNKETTGQQTK